MVEQYPWRDKQLVKRLYHDEKLSQAEIADRLGTTQPVICQWMDRHDITARDRTLANSLAKGPLSLRTNENGYEIFGTRRDYEPKKFLHHRLLAVAEYGFDAVKGKVVHHKNGVPWDNRGDNIEIMTDNDHKSKHADERERQGGRFVR